MLKRIYNNITSMGISLFFVGLMFMLPFVSMYHRLPIPSFYGEWVSAVLGVMAMIAMLRKDAWNSMQIPQIAFILAGLAAILGMQWMLGMLHSAPIALLILSYLGWAFVLVVLGNYLRRELGWEKLVMTLAYFVVAGGVVNAGIVALQYAAQSGLSLPIMPKLVGYGAIAQANHFANYTALATASLIYLYAKGRFSLKSSTLMLALFMVMFSFSGSRSSWLYMFAFTVLAIGLQINAMKTRQGSTAMRSLLRVTLTLLPVFAVTQLIIYYFFPNGLITLPTERLLDAANSTTASPRLLFWYDSWRMFINSPWLGVGAGNMRIESFSLLDYPTAMAAKRIFEHSHNLFLHLMAEMGVGAALIVLVGIVAWLRSFKWREFNLETWWLIAMLAVLGIHSMLEYPLWYTYFLGIAAILLGAGDEKLTTLRMPKWGEVSARLVFFSLLIVAAVQLSSLFVANDKLEIWLRRAIRGEITTTEHPQFINALSWVHGNSVLSPYAELMFATTILPNTSQLDEKLLISQSAMNFIPMRRIAYHHVLLLKLKGDHAGAVKLLNRTLIAHPGKFKEELETLPLRYWQDYLDVLSEARPIPIKKK